MPSLKKFAVLVLTLVLLPICSSQAEVVLYGVTGDGDSTPETLYTISTADASYSFFMTLGNGNDGETIAYNPLDGQMYHWSGYNGGEIMERIDLGTQAITDIPLSGFAYTEAFSATYDASSGNFLATDLNDDFVSITPSGFVTQLGSPGFATRGLGFVGSTLYALEHKDAFNGDDELDLLTLDAANGSVLDSITVTLSGVDLNGSSNGLAINPETGELYGVVQGTAGLGGNQRRLVTIDPLTGVATEIGTLSSNFAGIAFANNSAVPEPSSTLLLSALAIGGLFYRYRRTVVRGRTKKS